MPPEVRITRLLARAGRRLFAIEAAAAIAVASIVSLVWVIARTATGAARVEILVAPAALMAAAIAWAALRAARRTTAAAIEKRTRTFQNALVTSDQILRGEIQTKPEIRALVLEHTSARVKDLDLTRVMPARRPFGAAVIGLAALAGAVAFGMTRPQAAGNAPDAAASDGPIAITGIEITVTPPGYAGMRTVRVENPERLEVFEGSRIDVRASFTRGPGFAGQFVADKQTYVEIPVPGGVPALIPLSITPDRAPLVRITEPGRDLFLASPNRTIPVRVTAQDDLGVTSLTLAYTKVSGSGETFQFVEGTLPLSTTGGSRGLSATASINLSTLGLATGDMLVYRAIARDAQPSRPPVESDAFVIELVSASEAIAEGFSIDDQRDKYALSQQMVILKTERLMARRGGMAPAAVAEEAAIIAAEQRQVRAEFVFMMGGEVEDEEVEAEQSSEIAEGREQNEGRRDLIGAIRAMSDAAALLTKPLLDDALASEKRALVQLLRALTRSRYILRVLALRERIDDTRRLTGDRSGAPGWRRETAAPPASRESETLRDAFIAVSALARRDRYADAERRALSNLARLLLTLPDPHAREAADALNAASRGGDARAAAALLDRAALAIDAALEARTAAASTPAAAVPDRVRGALFDRLRAPRAPGGGR